MTADGALPQTALDLPMPDLPPPGLPMPAGPVMSLPAWSYCERRVYEAERKAIFFKEWQFIGCEKDLPQPGDYLATEITGWRIFALRARDGSLRAYYNMCSHRAAQLLEPGKGHCDVLRCAYHGWVFDAEGRLKATPHFGEADWFNKKDFPLTPIRIDSWRGLIFVCLDPAAKPLAESLGALPDLVAPYPIERFAKLDEASFEMRCNWKTYTDNFAEGYHIPGIHPGLIQAIDFNGFETTFADRVVIMKAPQKNGSIYGGIWLWIWPNMTLSVYPDGMNTSRILPLDEGRTQLIYNFYFADLSPEKLPAHRQTIETNCGIVREDFGICEISQGNLAAGIHQRGPLSPRHEEGLRYYHHRLRQALAGVGIGGL